MQISVKKSLSLNMFLCAGIVVGSISFKKAEAFTLFTIPGTEHQVTSTKIALIAAVGIITRLAMKDDPKKEGRIDLNNFFEELKKRDTIKAKLSFCVEFIDDVIIGYKGKINGPKVFAETKIVIDGEAAGDAVKTETNSLGEKIEWRRIPHVFPYGLIGTIWSNAKTVSKELDSVKGLASTCALVAALYNAPTLIHIWEHLQAGKAPETKAKA